MSGIEFVVQLGLACIGVVVCGAAAVVVVTPPLVGGLSAGAAALADSGTGKNTYKKRVTQIGGGLALASGGFIVGKTLVRRYRYHENDRDVLVSLLSYCGVASGCTAAFFAGGVPWTYGRFVSNDTLRKEPNNMPELIKYPKSSDDLQVTE